MKRSEHCSDSFPIAKATRSNSALKAIAYSMDALIPGLYVWFGSACIRLGGSLPEESYSGTIHSPIGIALVLPGYRIHSTYHGSYDP